MAPAEGVTVAVRLVAPVGTTLTSGAPAAGVESVTEGEPGEVPPPAVVPTAAMEYEVAGVRPVTVHRGVVQEVMSGLPPPRGDAVTVYGPPTEAGAWMVISADVGDAGTTSSAGALQTRGAVPLRRQDSGCGSASSRE